MKEVKKVLFASQQTRHEYKICSFLFIYIFSWLAEAFQNWIFAISLAYHGLSLFVFNIETCLTDFATSLLSESNVIKPASPNYRPAQMPSFTSLTCLTRFHFQDIIKFNAHPSCFVSRFSLLRIKMRIRRSLAKFIFSSSLPIHFRFEQKKPQTCKRKKISQRSEQENLY